MAAILTYIATASAMITASAAVYVAATVRDELVKIGENEQRSKRNRTIFTGEAEHFDGVLERLDRVEDRVGVDN